MHSDRDDRETGPSKQTGGRPPTGWPAEFDEAAVQELVELCLKPGVSIARMAMDHDVNPNQLRRWISRYQQHTLQTPTRSGPAGDRRRIDRHPGFGASFR
jgi:transposase-like protein